MAIGRAVVYNAQTAHALSAGIKCRHCMISNLGATYPKNVNIYIYIYYIYYIYIYRERERERERERGERERERERERVVTYLRCMLS